MVDGEDVLHDRGPETFVVGVGPPASARSKLLLERETLGDVDVAVSVEPGGLPDGDVTAYELALEGVLDEQGLGVPVDVRVLEDAPVSFQYAVTRGETLVVRDPEAWAVFRERTWNAYLDFACARSPCATWPVESFRQCVLVALNSLAHSASSSASRAGSGAEAALTICKL